MSTPGFTEVWQDQEIRFDVPISQLDCRKGEYMIDSINSVEDTKGGSGERGSLIITNLRILWVCHKSSRTNLSIGLNCTLSISIRVAKSKLRGSTQALCILTKFQTSRFEFIFTSLVRNSPRMFTTVQTVLRAYETTKLYRELKLRGSIVKDMQLILLPHEQIYNQVSGAWNLSSDQGNLGSFFITNVRVVWVANMAQNFNVSLPYMQIKSIRIRESKFGQALVLDTTQRSGGYILGFRLDPPDMLSFVYKELTSLHSIYAINPNFGVDYLEEEKPAILEKRRVPKIDDDVEISETETRNTDAFAAYYVEQKKAGEREIVFDASLGLAIESLPAGITMNSLWSVV